MRSAAVLGLAVVLATAPLAVAAPAAAAPAADTCAQSPAAAWESGPLTVEYGVDWSTTARGTGLQNIDPWEGNGTLTGGPSGYKAGSGDFPADDDPCGFIVAVFSGGTMLPAGTYSLQAWFGRTPDEKVQPPAPLALKITPAALGITARVATDPTNPRNAIVTTQFTGPFAQNFPEYYGSTSYEGAPHTPEGTWKVIVADAAGTEITSFTADRAPTVSALGESWIWLDAPAGEYTATATFTTAGASTQDFAVAASAPASFTAPGPAPGDAPTASPAPTAPPAAAESGLTLPAWIPLVAGVITAGLLALTIVQIVRTAKRRRPSVVPPPEVPA